MPQFLVPVYLWLLLALPAVLALYFLKSKPMRRQIASNLIWRLVLERLKPNSFLQRFQNSLFLLLQIAAVSLVVFGLARPLGLGWGGVNRVILIDVSTSMHAVDVAPTRFEAARQRALALLDSAGSGRVAVYALADQARPLQGLGDDNAAVRRAVVTLAPTHAVSPDAGKVLRQLRQIADRENSDEIYILSDCLRLSVPRDFLPGTAISLEIFGRGENNVALCGAEIDWAPGRASAEALVTVVNENDSGVPARLRVETTGKPAPAETVLNLDARGVTRVKLTTLPAPPFVLRLEAPPGANLCPADDAWFVGEPSGRPRVLLSAPPDSVLHRLAAAMPLVEFASVTADAAVSSSAMAVVAMGVVPAALASLPSCVFAPGPDPLRTGEVLPVPGDHPLLRYTDWDAVDPEALRPADLPGLPVVEAIGGTLLAEDFALAGARRIGHITVAIDPDHPAVVANLFLPVLLYNALEYLLADTFPRHWFTVGHPGLSLLYDGDPPMKTGFHPLPRHDGVKIAVNMDSMAEADIAPAVAVTPTTAQNAVRRGKDEMASPWLLLVTLAVVLILGEWYLYLRQT